ncbi:MAG TPA: DUF1109 domain-containing protein [Xanthobacteraceae bacterium]|nr:DUF1109 domain-containing protein [Xanthobacteraceae bacterium]
MTSSKNDPLTERNPRRSVMAVTLLAGTCAAALPVLAVVVLLLARNPQIEGGSINSALAFNIAVWLTLAASALWALVELAQPGGSRRAWTYLLPAPILLGSGMAAELARTPSSTWTTRIVGGNAATCVTLVTLFSMPILTSLIYVLRSVVVTTPRFAGAAAGLLAGSVSAAIYVWHNQELSLLFVATWPGLAVMIVAVLGAIVGRKFLSCAVS